MTTAELIEKLERAEEPSAQLDLAIVEWCQDNRVKGLCGYPGVPNYDPELWLERNGPITASIDAALTLVPEGWRPYSADMSVKGRTRFLIEGPKTQWSTDEDGEKCAGNDWYSQGIAPTPAIALVIAALKAKEADNG